MKNTVFYLLTLSLSFLLWSCGSDSSVNDNAFAKEPEVPQGALFNYLIYDNDFNAVPQDGNPAEYGTKFRPTDGSGMSFELTNVRQYSPGANGFINLPKKGEWYKIHFRCFKEAAADPANIKGFVVVSLSRKDSIYHYKAYTYTELLKEQNKNLVGNWTHLTVWHKAPEDILSGDRLQIYHWNPEGGSLYLDDFVVEAWTTIPAPAGVALSHGLMEQNYETPELERMTTKETASRGVASCVLSAAGVQFGEGFTGTLEESQIQSGDYIKVSFAALKKHKTIAYASSANMVFSLERNQQQVSWEGMPIEPGIYKEGKQLLGEWVNLTIWKQIPADAQPKDILKIYPWNAQPNPVYVDDLRIEVWRGAVAN